MNEHIQNGRPLPTTIPQYLAQLREALAGADPAMIQDALYDAEEYLRSELAEQPGRSEAEVIAGVAGSYGAPEEVAEIYRETEITVSRALRTPVVSAAPTRKPAGAPPSPPKPRSLLARFFGVAVDPHTYGALFYMLLSLATGVFFFSWVITGLSLSFGLMILIIGIPVTVLFFGSVRGLALLEGRLVEVLLGERMPRRPTYTDRSRGWLQRIGDMFTDSRTWLTMLYFVLMLPLGIAYFTVTVTLLATSIGLIWAPVGVLFDTYGAIYWDGEQLSFLHTVLMMLGGVLLLFLTLHLARGVGKVHGLVAKHLLVSSRVV